MNKEIFIESKYTKIYWSIVKRAQCRQIPGEYTELHHIIPKSLGGDNSPSNFVNLTAREHFICHRLLVKITTGSAKRSMSFALFRMVHGRNDVRITNRTYQLAREMFSQSMKDWWNENPQAKDAAAQRGRELMSCSNHKEKMKNHIREYWAITENRELASQRMTEWWRSLSQSQLENLRKKQVEANTPEVRTKKSHPGKQNGMYGRTHTNEVKQKLSKQATEKFKGKSYEDLYGKEKAEELKLKRRESTKKARSRSDYSGKKNPNAKKVSIKGKVFDTSADAAVYFGKSRPTISEWLRKYDDCYFIT